MSPTAAFDAAWQVALETGGALKQRRKQPLMGHGRFAALKV